MLFGEYFSHIIMATILFSSAGTFRWWNTWVLLGFSFINVIGSHLLVALSDPDLYNVRGKKSEPAERWDLIILKIGSVFPFITLLIAGLNYRFHWSSIGSIWMVPGIVLIITCGFLTIWTMRVNRFYTTIVRIQKERGQKVITNGPYKIIRHPGYAAQFFYYTGISLMLDSPLSFIPVFCILLLLMIRIIREEKILVKGLEGYQEYTQQTKYRLFPGIW